MGLWRNADGARMPSGGACGQDYWMREEVKHTVSRASDQLYLRCGDNEVKAILSAADRFLGEITSCFCVFWYWRGPRRFTCSHASGLWARAHTALSRDCLYLTIRGPGEHVKTWRSDLCLFRTLMTSCISSLFLADRRRVFLQLYMFRPQLCSRITCRQLSGYCGRDLLPFSKSSIGRETRSISLRTSHSPRRPMRCAVNSPSWKHIFRCCCWVLSTPFTQTHHGVVPSSNVFLH
jgi:hypothetical protein